MNISSVPTRKLVSVAIRKISLESVLQGTKEYFVLNAPLDTFSKETFDAANAQLTQRI
jgi:hypothetical protein